MTMLLIGFVLAIWVGVLIVEKSLRNGWGLVAEVSGIALVCSGGAGIGILMGIEIYQAVS